MPSVRGMVRGTPAFSRSGWPAYRLCKLVLNPDIGPRVQANNQTCTIPGGLSCAHRKSGTVSRREPEEPSCVPTPYAFGSFWLPGHALTTVISCGTGEVAPDLSLARPRVRITTAIEPTRNSNRSDVSIPRRQKQHTWNGNLPGRGHTARPVRVPACHAECQMRPTAVPLAVG